jgi:acyl dehydratase
LKPVYFEDLVEGHVDESAEVIADRDDMVAYAERNDPYPRHVDEQFAATSPTAGSSPRLATRCRCTTE